MACIRRGPVTVAVGPSSPFLGRVQIWRLKLHMSVTYVTGLVLGSWSSKRPLLAANYGNDRLSFLLLLQNLRYFAGLVNQKYRPRNVP